MSVFDRARILRDEVKVARDLGARIGDSGAVYNAMRLRVMLTLLLVAAAAGGVTAAL